MPQHPPQSSSATRSAGALAAGALLVACSGEPTGPALEPGPPAAAAVEIDPGEAEMTALGDTLPFSATVQAEDGSTLDGVEITWSSLDMQVAQINERGVATGLGAGEARIVAAVGSPGGTGSTAVADTALLTVTQELASLAVEPAEVAFQTLGDTITLRAVARDANAHEIPTDPTEFEWSSSNTEAAEVDEAGLVTAIGPGSATITAEREEEEAAAEVEVLGPQAQILEPPAGARFEKGAEVTFRAEAVDARGNALTGELLAWHSDRDGELGKGENLTKDDLSVGEHAITLRVTDEHGARGTARTDMEVAFDLGIVALHVSQSVQDGQGSVPLVSDRPGLLRVYVRANAENEHRPPVRVELLQDGAHLETFDLSAPDPGVREQVDPASPDGSWTLELPPEWIQPGLEVRAEVDPAGTIDVWSRDDNRFPASGEPLALDVRPLPRFEGRLIPIHLSGGGTTGDVTEENKDTYLDLFARALPVGEIDVDVRRLYTSSLGAEDGSVDRTALLHEMRVLRGFDGAHSRYYYGVMRPSGGVAMLGAPYAVGSDGVGGISPPELVRTRIYAHELGHNFNLLHSPCGNPPTHRDPEYPYGDGSIGVWGWDRSTGESVPPHIPDVMGGCWLPNWISDYHYVRALEYREFRAERDAEHARAGEPLLVLWGRVSAEGVALEPAFVATAGRFEEPEPGPYRLEGLDDPGRVLFSRSFQGLPVAAAELDEHIFTFGIPLAEVDLDRLVAIRVRGEGHERTLRSALAPRAPGVDPANEPDAALRLNPMAALQQAARAVRPERVSPDRVRLRWDAARYPLVVVRDARTGDVLSLARGGDMELLTGARELEIDLSDGVRSATERVTVEH